MEIGRIITEGVQIQSTGGLVERVKQRNEDIAQALPYRFPPVDRLCRQTQEESKRSMLFG